MNSCKIEETLKYGMHFWNVVCQFGHCLTLFFKNYFKFLHNHIPNTYFFKVYTNNIYVK